MSERITEYITGISSASQNPHPTIGIAPNYIDKAFRGRMRRMEIMKRASDRLVHGIMSPDWRRIVVHGFLLPLRDGFETLKQEDEGETRIGVYKLYLATQQQLFLVGDHINTMDRFWRVRNMQDFSMSRYISYTIERIPDFSLTGEELVAFNDARTSK